jgi:hypothetical protein
MGTAPGPGVGEDVAAREALALAEELEPFAVVVDICPKGQSDGQ